MTLIQVTPSRTLDLSVRFSVNPSNQDIADCIVYHLGTMKEQSITPNPSFDPLEAEDVDNPKSICAYRGDDSNSCAFGYVLKDEEYSEAMENKPVDALKSRRMMPRRLECVCQHLLRELQKVHDDIYNWSYSRERMPSDLRRVYIMFDLDDSILRHPDLIWNKAA